MKLVGLYARVSTNNQENEKTIDSQISEIKEKIVKDGRMLGDNLSFCDNGWSGSILARPELDRLRDAVKAKLFQVLYIYDYGRLSRDIGDQILLRKELQEAGIEIIAIHDINGSTLETYFQQNIMGMFHDYERKKIAERFRRGKLFRAKTGYLFGWNAPYGYKLIKGDKKKLTPATFEIHKEEADRVKMMFQWLIEEQLTMRQIIMRLFEEKILPRKNKQGHWSTSTLSRLFRDETYIGTTYYNKRIAIKPENPRNKDAYKHFNKSSRKFRDKKEWLGIKVPAIIDNNTFNKAQQQLKTNSQFCMRNRVHEYLLSTLVKCSCGNTRAGEGVKSHLYYRCTDRVNRFPLPKECFKSGVNATILDMKVWKEIYNLITNPKLIEKQYDRWKVKITTNQQNHDYIDVEKLRKELDEQKEHEERFVKAYGAKVISLEQLQSQLMEIKLKKSQIMGKLATSRDNNPPTQKSIILPDLRHFCDTMKAEIDHLDFKERQFIIRQLIDSVVTDGATASVEGSLPLVITEENTQNNYGQNSINRDRRTSKRRKKYII